MLPPLLALAQTLGTVYLLTEAAKSCSATNAHSAVVRAELDVERTRLTEKGRTVRAAMEFELERELAAIHARLARDLRAIDLLERDIENRSAGQRAWLDAIRQLNARLGDPRLPVHEMMAILEIIMTAHARLAGETRSTSELVVNHVRMIVREFDDGRRRLGARPLRMPPGLSS